MPDPKAASAVNVGKEWPAAQTDRQTGRQAGRHTCLINHTASSQAAPRVSHPAGQPSPTKAARGNKEQSLPHWLWLPHTTPPTPTPHPPSHPQPPIHPPTRPEVEDVGHTDAAAQEDQDLSHHLTLAAGVGWVGQGER